MQIDARVTGNSLQSSITATNLREAASCVGARPFRAHLLRVSLRKLNSSARE